MARVGAVGAALALTACGGTTPQQRYTSVDELFGAAGGREWCGTELRVTIEPAVGNCGPDESRVALAAAYDRRSALLESVGGAIGDGLVVLVPKDVDHDDWFQLRATDAEPLREAQRTIGGLLLDSDEDIERWLDRHGG